jgi:hypothetical protein
MTEGQNPGRRFDQDLVPAVARALLSESGT